MVNGIVDEKLRAKFFKKTSLTWTRIRLGFSAEEHKKLVAAINNDVVLLGQLIKNAIGLQEERQERSSSSTSRYWLALRSHTHRLYHALQSIWPHTCPTHTHRVILQLDIPGGEETDCEIVQFCLSFSLINEHIQPPWGSRDVKVLSIQAPPSP